MQPQDQKMKFIAGIKLVLGVFPRLVKTREAVPCSLGFGGSHAVCAIQIQWRHIIGGPVLPLSTITKLIAE